MKTIKSTDCKQVVADSFELLVDPKPKRPGVNPAIGFKVDTVDGHAFIIPIEFGTAKSLAMMMLKTLLLNAPQLFHEHSQEK